MCSISRLSNRLTVAHTYVPGEKSVEYGVESAVRHGNEVERGKESVVGGDVELVAEPVLGVALDEREGEERAPAHDEHQPDSDQHADDGQTRLDVTTLGLCLVVPTNSHTTRQQPHDASAATRAPRSAKCPLS